MPFACPECARKKSLEIVMAIELPPDSRSDEITLQVVECRACGFLGAAVYEESRRGALGNEAFDHTGYWLDGNDADRLKALISACPRPRDGRCDCAAHQELGKQDQTGRWNGLSGVDLPGTFAMVYSSEEESS